MTEYLKDLAKEYGLDLEGGQFRRNGHLVLNIYKSIVVKGAFMWEVYPLGENDSRRTADGNAPTPDEALVDVEGMLRHYLVCSYTREEVEAFWSAEILESILPKGAKLR